MSDAHKAKLQRDEPRLTMKLWLLQQNENASRSDDYDPYEQLHGGVIRAPSEDRARAIAAKYHGSEARAHPEFWADPKFSTCVELTADGPEEYVALDSTGGG